MAFAYQAGLQTDLKYYYNENTDPRVHNAKYNMKQLDQDIPTFHQARSGLVQISICVL